MVNVLSVEAPRRMVGRYELVESLATGELAEVWLARASGLHGFERELVIKRIRAELADDERVVKMFLDEARLAASLHHQNIVQVHDIGHDGDDIYFAMEYVDGVDVRRLLSHVVERDKRVPLDVAVGIVMYAAAALHYAHEHKGSDLQPLGIVHRDVSPANIIVGSDGTVKVVDFGIAKASYRSFDTRSGALRGKVAYMSPEACLGKPVDRRSDVFGLGICMYELATARRLFKGDNEYQTMFSIVHGAVPSPSTIRQDIPPQLQTIIMRALSPAPLDRYPTADSMRAALEMFALNNGMRTSSTALAEHMKQQFGDRPKRVASPTEFDGGAAGVVPVPDSAIRDLPVPDNISSTGSPIMKARGRLLNDNAGRSVDNEATMIDEEPARGDTVRDDAPASGEARAAGAIAERTMTIIVGPPEEVRRRRRFSIYAIASAALGAALVATIVVALIPGDDLPSPPSPPVDDIGPLPATEPPPAPAAEPATEPAPEPAPEPDPALEPVMEPVVVVEPVVADKPTKRERSRTRSKPAKSKPKRTKRPRSPDWNPDELFPTKR